MRIMRDLKFAPNQNKQRFFGIYFLQFLRLLKFAPNQNKTNLFWIVIYVSINMFFFKCTFFARKNLLPIKTKNKSCN